MRRFEACASTSTPTMRSHTRWVHDSATQATRADTLQHEDGIRSLHISHNVACRPRQRIKNVTSKANVVSRKTRTLRQHPPIEKTSTTLLPTLSGPNLGFSPKVPEKQMMRDANRLYVNVSKKRDLGRSHSRCCLFASVRPPATRSGTLH
jgi:hypothetical protein